MSGSMTADIVCGLNLAYAHLIASLAERGPMVCSADQEVPPLRKDGAELCERRERLRDLLCEAFPDLDVERSYSSDEEWDRALDFIPWQLQLKLAWGQGSGAAAQASLAREERLLLALASVAGHMALAVDCRQDVAAITREYERDAWDFLIHYHPPERREVQTARRGLIEALGAAGVDVDPLLWADGEEWQRLLLGLPAMVESR